MSETKTDEILKQVEKRLDSRLDALEKLLSQSMASIKLIYDINHQHIEEKIESLESTFNTYVSKQELKREEKEEKEKERDEIHARERKNHKLTIALAFIGWIVLFGLNYLTKDDSVHHQPDTHVENIITNKK